jgi:hypothetical protein
VERRNAEERSGRADLSDDSGGDLLGVGASSEVLRLDALDANAFDGLHELVGGLLLTEPLEHFRGAPEGRNGVRDAHSRDVESGAVDGLEHYRWKNKSEKIKDGRQRGENALEGDLREGSRLAVGAIPMLPARAAARSERISACYEDEGGEHEKKRRERVESDERGW